MAHSEGNPSEDTTNELLSGRQELLLTARKKNDVASK